TIRDKLAPPDATPPVVVLNACHTAGTHLVQESNSLAQELAERGVPLVVGMSGRVADRACRLFTRCFYEALLKGQDVALVTAEARRRAVRDGNVDACATADWTMPTLFTLENVRLRPDSEAMAEAVRRAGVAKEYRTLTEPKVYCDPHLTLSRPARYVAGGGS